MLASRPIHGSARPASEALAIALRHEARFGLCCVSGEVKHVAVDTQRLSIRGRSLEADDQSLQDALAAVYEAPERPRCQCVPGGVEMYVGFHRRYLAKRMPDTGNQHHPACPSFEPSPQQSGLGELVGDAVLESGGAAELRVDFAWSRQAGSRAPDGQADDGPGEIEAPRRRMSLRALTHFLFERAGFNRWSPVMAGKRSQGVLHKYLLRAAEQVRAKGVALGERLYVPEQFNEATRAEAAERRRERLVATARWRGTARSLRGRSRAAS